MAVLPEYSYKFAYVPNIQCPICKLMLMLKWEEGTQVLMHEKILHCVFSGKKFKAPTIELEEI